MVNDKYLGTFRYIFLSCYDNVGLGETGKGFDGEDMDMNNIFAVLSIVSDSQQWETTCCHYSYGLR